MFNTIEPLDKTKHQDLKFTPKTGYAFAANLSSAPLSASELIRASRYYPIVFSTQQKPLPHALFSLQKGNNTFVDSNGTWRAPYIPAYIRRYPFILGKVGDDEKYVLSIDPQAPHFSKEQG